jgi:hypothetical protein
VRTTEGAAGGAVPGVGERRGVAWPEDHLRERMATAHKVGALEIEVQVRLFQGGANGTSVNLTRMWCQLLSEDNRGESGRGTSQRARCSPSRIGLWMPSLRL